MCCQLPLNVQKEETNGAALAINKRKMEGGRIWEDTDKINKLLLFFSWSVNNCNKCSLRQNLFWGLSIPIKCIHNVLKKEKPKQGFPCFLYLIFDVSSNIF